MTPSCPACHANMTARYCGEVEVDTCEACGGWWFDANELQTYLDHQGTRDQTLAFPGGGVTTKSTCPRCATSLNRTSARGVTFEFCPTCTGIFATAPTVDRLLRNWRRSTPGDRAADAGGSVVGEILIELTPEVIGGVLQALFNALP